MLCSTVIVALLLVQGLAAPPPATVPPTTTVPPSAPSQPSTSSSPWCFLFASWCSQDSPEAPASTAAPTTTPGTTTTTTTTTNTPAPTTATTTTSATTATTARSTASVTPSEKCGGYLQKNWGCSTWIYYVLIVTATAVLSAVAVTLAVALKTQKPPPHPYEEKQRAYYLQVVAKIAIVCFIATWSSTFLCDLEAQVFTYYELIDKDTFVATPDGLAVSGIGLVVVVFFTGLRMSGSEAGVVATILLTLSGAQVSFMCSRIYAYAAHLDSIYGAMVVFGVGFVFCLILLGLQETWLKLDLPNKIPVFLHHLGMNSLLRYGMLPVDPNAFGMRIGPNAHDKSSQYPSPQPPQPQPQRPIRSLSLPAVV